jgi:hypothetical protein
MLCKEFGHWIVMNKNEKGMGCKKEFGLLPLR